MVDEDAMKIISEFDVAIDLDEETDANLDRFHIDHGRFDDRFDEFFRSANRIGIVTLHQLDRSGNPLLQFRVPDLENPGDVGQGDLSGKRAHQEPPSRGDGEGQASEAEPVAEVMCAESPSGVARAECTTRLGK